MISVDVHKDFIKVGLIVLHVLPIVLVVWINIVV